MMFHDLSVRAEEVVPSMHATAAATASTSRHRAVNPPVPPPLTFTPRNFVDSEIFGKMAKDGVRWTSPSTDEEFLRRVMLDLTGEIPDAETVKAFLADTSANKRDALVDKLLATETFNDRWTMWLGDLLQNVQTATNSSEQVASRNAYYRFIRDSIASRKPYDQTVRELLNGNGNSATNGAATFWIRQIQNNGPIQDTYDNLSAFSGERFLGLPLVCLSCHNGLGHLELVNSSLAKHTRYEFWRNAAFFARTSVATTRDSANNNVFTITDNAAGEYRLGTKGGNKTDRIPLPGQSSTVDPAFILSTDTMQTGENRRQAYGRMLTAHPQFARATVNYIWKEIFGAGIVEPADSFDLARQDPATLAPNATLQPTHPQLLTLLASSFVANNYDLRALLRTIVTSNAYQLSSRYTPGDWREAWAPYYARHYPRRLMGEEVLDAIAKATGVPATYNVAGFTITHAMQLPDPTEGGGFRTFLNNFERGNRDDETRNSDSSIVQALGLLNDRIVTDRIKSSSAATLVARLLKQSTDPATIAEGLYLNTLSRYPTSDEKSRAVTYLKSGELAKKTEDLQFALMNKLEFFFN